MPELIDALDAQGNPTGEKKTKEQIFADGDWRRVIHVWIVNSKGELLTQQRVKKGIFDHLWDTSVGGGVSAGEKPISSAVREVGEELGLKVRAEELELLGEWPLPKMIPERQQMTNEFSSTYLLRRDVELSQLNPEPKEVAAVKWRSLQEVEGLISGPDYAQWVPHGRDYYMDVINLIRSREK